MSHDDSKFIFNSPLYVIIDLSPIITLFYTSLLFYLPSAVTPCRPIYLQLAQS